MVGSIGRVENYCGDGEEVEDAEGVFGSEDGDDGDQDHDDGVEDEYITSCDCHAAAERREG